MYKTIDIQLVPSAGMSLKLFATRTGGYLFNCDGWNQKPNGGRELTIEFDGPNPFIVLDDAKRGVSVSPAFPHSAVACGAGKETMVGTCLTPKPPMTTDNPSESLSNVIFGYGPGELHFYEAQLLPE